MAEENKRRREIADAALAAYVDESVPNLSSIVVLAEWMARRMLLTGDARGDKILEGLELVGLLRKPNHACGRAESAPSRQLQQHGTSFFDASLPTTMCSPGTASTATPSARPWRCSFRRAARTLQDPSDLSDRDHRRRAERGLGKGAGQGKEAKKKTQAQKEVSGKTGRPRNMPNCLFQGHAACRRPGSESSMRRSARNRSSRSLGSIGRLRGSIIRRGVTAGPEAATWPMRARAREGTANSCVAGSPAQPASRRRLARADRSATGNGECCHPAGAREGRAAA